MGATPKIHHAIDDVIGNYTSDTIHTARFHNKRGIHYSRWTIRTGRFELQLQGRPDNSSPWVTLRALTEVDHQTTGNRAYASAVFHWPQIRYVWTIISGAPTIQAWYIE